jgi:hypothetical protein
MPSFSSRPTRRVPQSRRRRRSFLYVAELAKRFGIVRGVEILDLDICELVPGDGAETVASGRARTE